MTTSSTPISTQDYYSLYGLFAAARVPVDGSGMLAALPEVAKRPVNPELEQEIVKRQTEIDDFINVRLEKIRAEFLAPEKLRQYLLLAETQLAKTDKEIREYALAEKLDERVLSRWVRYLKNTAKTPHAVWAPWHALAAVSEADFVAQAAAVIDKVKAEKLNPHVVALLSPAPASLPELAGRYIDLLIKFDGAESSKDFDVEQLRQILRSNDSPPLLPVNDLINYLTADDKQQLTQYKRALAQQLAALPENADHYLLYRHDAAPAVSEIEQFVKERTAAAATALRTPEKIAASLVLAHEAQSLPENRFKSAVKGKQLSERIVRRWMEYLRAAEVRDDDIFAPWQVFTAAASPEFSEPANAALAERARAATKNPLVAAALGTPPTSLGDAARAYAELIVRYDRAERYDGADEEAIRQISAAADSPLRFADHDAVDYFTQKDYDELRNKERKLLRVYLESAGTPHQAMIVGETTRSYAQRVFVRGKPNVPGEMTHGGFLSAYSSGGSQPFVAGSGRRELAEAIFDSARSTAARVVVNRVWQWHFGAGLVSTPSDFGVRGAAPSHPELLDWLAQKLVDDGWSLKKLHRRILSSATWQQASADDPRGRQVDPDNRLLWRMTRRRLSFEELRDSLLAAAGRLDLKLGWPAGQSDE